MASLALVTGSPLLAVGAVLLGLLILLAQLGRRIRRGPGSGPRTVRLTQAHAVHVVEIAGRRLLLGTGPSGAPRVLVELGEVEPSDELVAEEAGPWSWSSLVGAARGR
jgi:hypothetical protein